MTAINHTDCHTIIGYNHTCQAGINIPQLAPHYEPIQY